MSTTSSHRNTAKIRRELRKQRNIAKNQKAKIEAIRKGKIIKEEHGQGMYSDSYCENSAIKLISLIIKEGDYQVNENVLQRIQKYKDQILNLLVYWSRYYPYGHGSLQATDTETVGVVVHLDRYEKLCKLIEIYYKNETIKRNCPHLFNSK
jgi:hypothetical protein